MPASASSITAATRLRNAVTGMAPAEMFKYMRALAAIRETILQARRALNAVRTYHSFNSTIEAGALANPIAVQATTRDTTALHEGQLIELERWLAAFSALNTEAYEVLAEVVRSGSPGSISEIA